MASGLDKSLDDMIKDKPRPQRRRRVPSAKDAVLGARNVGAGAAARAVTRAAALPAPVAKAAATNEPTATQQQASAMKIIVSNLPLDVGETQVKELFAATVGPTKECTLHYNAQGKSKGVAHVTFRNKGDGFKAYKEYNNRLIDQNKPMKIELILEPIKPAPPTLASRVAPAPVAARPARTVTQPRAATNGAAVAARGAIRGRGTRGRGAARGGRPVRRAPKTAADLDQEMEDYSTAPAGDAKAAATVAV